MLTEGPSPAEIEAKVLAAIHQLLDERGEAPAAIGLDDKLNATLGLSSIDLALLVAELEAALAVDPFRELVSITGVRAVGDLVAAYCLAFGHTPGHAPGSAPLADTDAELRQAAERARARRDRARRG